MTQDTFSTKIDKIAKMHERSCLSRLRHAAWLRLLMIAHAPPFQFELVGKEGEPVGPPIKVPHLNMGDIRWHLLQGAMTTLVLRFGVRTNAFEVVGIEHLGNCNAVTTIQPRWIERQTA